MKTTKILRIFGIGVLGLVWAWLAWGFLSSKGITLLNLILLGMTAIIIFLPLYRKYIASSDNKKSNDIK